MADLAHNGSFLFYVLAAIGLCSIMIGLAAFLGGKAKGRSKNTPFESGVDSVGTARLRFSAKFYLIAMFFVIFDVEALFLFEKVAGLASLKQQPLSSCYWLA